MLTYFDLRDAGLSRCGEISHFRRFVSDVRWAVELDARVQAKNNMLKSRRTSARSAWNRLQVRREKRICCTYDEPEKRVRQGEETEGQNKAVADTADGK